MNWQNSKWDANLFRDGSAVSLMGLQPDSAAVCKHSKSFAIMVVEDDDVQRDILMEQLNSVGLKVFPASNVAEAQSILGTAKLDMAIMDIDLPDGCGLELCEATVDTPETAHLPIIMLSSINDPFLVRRTRAAGGHFFIGKPYDPNVLLAMIERLLDVTL